MPSSGFASEVCSPEAAIKRRLYEELAISCALKFLFKFHYRALHRSRRDRSGGDSRLALEQPRGVAAGIVGARREELYSVVRDRMDSYMAGSPRSSACAAIGFGPG